MNTQTPTETFTNVPPPDIKALIDEHGVVFRQEPMKLYLDQRQFISAGKLHQIISTTPRQFLYNWLTPETEASDALRMGTALHTAVLEPQEFKKQYDCLRRDSMPYPDRDFRNTQNKERRDTFLKGCEMRGTIMLTEEEMDTVNYMVAALANNSTAKNILSQKGITEISIYTTMGYNGRTFYVKIRPDKISIQKPFFLDLKKTRNASPEMTKFPRDAALYGYDLKLALYHDVLKHVWTSLMKLTGIAETVLRRSLIIAIEDTPPFSLMVYNIPDEVIEMGRYKFNQALSRFSECLESQQWKDYEIYADNEAGVVDLVLPQWSNKEIVI